MKKLIVFFGIGFLASSLSYANPCDNDVEQMCSDVQPGLGNIGECLETHRDELTYSCREWLKKMDRSLKELKMACNGAARDFCRDVNPGYKRVKNCLMDNFDKLPASCQTALQNTGH